MSSRGWLLVVFLLAACRDASSSGTAPSASAQDNPPGFLQGSAASAGFNPPGLISSGGMATPSEVEDELSTRPMELLRFRFTSGVEGREPKDELQRATPGQRVYAFLAIRNRTGRNRTIHLAWSVAGEPRTTLDLEVEESWQFRTWGYNTVGAADRGILRLEVTDDAGNSLVERELPIRP